MQLTTLPALVIRYILLFMFAFYASTPFANPVINNMTDGTTLQADGNKLTVNQATPQAILNWHSFDIDTHQTTHFQQPQGGIALNRITSDQASKIHGTLSATGQLILVNSAGFHFGPNATVNVGGIIASTANISDKNFMARNYRFDQASTHNGAIINEGKINVADHGFAALLAQGVINNGRIQANLGHVVLASGSTFTVQLANNHLFHFSVDSETAHPGVDSNGKALKHGVKNTGHLIADGGTIHLSAKVVENVLDKAISMKGIAQANTVHEHKGMIILSGGNTGKVKVKNKLVASGLASGQKGGKVEINGKKIIAEKAEVNVNGKSGDGEFVKREYQAAQPIAAPVVQMAAAEDYVLVNHADLASPKQPQSPVIQDDYEHVEHDNLSQISDFSHVSDLSLSDFEFIEDFGSAPASPVSSHAAVNIPEHLSDSNSSILSYLSVADFNSAPPSPSPLLDTNTPEDMMAIALTTPVINGAPGGPSFSHDLISDEVTTPVPPTALSVEDVETPETPASPTAYVDTPDVTIDLVDDVVTDIGPRHDIPSSIATALNNMAVNSSKMSRGKFHPEPLIAQLGMDDMEELLVKVIGMKTNVMQNLTEIKDSAI
jgi:filamentous hemagglutinin family protein